MAELHWNGQNGSVHNQDKYNILTTKPVLTFEFDTISFVEGKPSFKALGLDRIALLEGEITKCIEYAVKHATKVPAGPGAAEQQELPIPLTLVK